MSTKEDVSRWIFQAIPEYFVDLSKKFQLDPSFRAGTLPGLGLIEREYDTDGNVTTEGAPQTPWHRFHEYVDHLNRHSVESTKYKVLYITRHGLGFHNTFEAEVGHDAWNNYWSHLDGDGTVVWADAHLNERGIQQAEELGRFWSRSIAEDQIPIPGSVYTSPLARCLETTRLEFVEVFKQHGRPFHPVVKESLRELVTDHTCDRRSSKSWIAAHYPECQIEPGFTEKDELWTGAHWETPEQHTARKQKALDDIFNSDESAFIALTVHSYAMSAILRVVGLDMFRVEEGSCIALFVRGDKL